MAQKQKKTGSPKAKRPAKRPSAKAKGTKPPKVYRPHGKEGAKGKDKARAKRRAAKAAAPAPRANEAALRLLKEMAVAVSERKASDVLLLDVRGKSSYADYILIATGESDRQLQAMADAIHEKLKPQGQRPLSTEGHEGGSWLLLDYGDVVAHLFQADTRGFYDLEGLWADAARLPFHG